MTSFRLLLVVLCFVTTSVVAQESGDYRFVNQWDQEDQSDEMIEVDTTLFRMPMSAALDSYGAATRYYRVQGASRRRGLYYTVAQAVVEPSNEYFVTLEEPLPHSEVALYAAQSAYRVGVRASHARRLSDVWSLSASLWSQTGRDQFVESVFRNTFSPEVVASRRYGDGHYLSLRASLYYSMRGLQSGTTAEAFDLVGSRYYNPSWGFYDGKVRNSRVRRDLSPALSAHYQRPINDLTVVVIDANVDYSRRANSSIGWYNAFAPTPDYYRKMPSFMPEGEVKDYVASLWRVNDTDYTQVNWGELVRLNSLSSDVNAFYTLEDRVERGVMAGLVAVGKSELDCGVTLTYGVKVQSSSDRYFKKMRDLLGASHLVDYDQFMGDSYNKTMPLQNNLQDPDNHILQGDRFGYDYSQHHTLCDALLRAQYRTQRFDFNLDATFGAENFWRVGHFQKERFADSSFGESATVILSPYALRASVGYAYRANSYFALKLFSSRLSPYARNLFLNESATNYLSPSLHGERINSAALAFRLNYPKVSLSGEVYALSSSEGVSVYSAYDDLTATMCRALISDIGYCSYGVEATAEFRFVRSLKLSATLAAGRYFYSSDPCVALLDDYDLSVVSSPTESRMSGVSIGNAPQIAATASMTYFGFDKYILSLSSSYAALRYEQPSILRRSERLLSQAFINDESAEAALSQRRLDDIFDVEVSAYRYFWFENGDRLSVRLSLRNLFGDDDRIVYAKESDRVMLQRVDGYFTGSSMRQSMWQYGAPRTAQLSVAYLF